MLRRLAGVATVIVLGTAYVPAQPAWHTLAMRDEPRAWRHAATLDSSRDVVVLHIGGSRETWEYDGSRWARGPAPPFSMPVRLGTAIAYCGATQRVVLYGGADGVTLNDTWEYDGASWTPGVPVPRTMVSRAFHGMVSDSARQRAVVFGGLTCPTGSNCTNFLSEVWEFDGTRWLPGPAPPPSVAPRVVFGMSYDTDQGQVVIFGGQSAPGVSLNDTWFYDGTAWSPGPSAPSGLGPRNGCRLAYDQLRQRHILFGGRTDTGYTNETWELSSSGWTQASSGLSNRYEPVLVYLPTTQRVVMNGGLPYEPGQTWEFYCPSITIQPTALPVAVQGVLYTQTLSASGGVLPFTFFLRSGSLPPGLSLSASGTIAGIPLQGGVFTFEIAAEDAATCVGVQDLSILVVGVFDDASLVHNPAGGLP